MTEVSWAVPRLSVATFDPETARSCDWSMSYEPDGVMENVGDAILALNTPSRGQRGGLQAIHPGSRQRNWRVAWGRERRRASPLLSGSLDGVRGAKRRRPELTSIGGWFTAAPSDAGMFRRNRPMGTHEVS